MLVTGQLEAADSSAPSIGEYIALLRNSQERYGGSIDFAIKKVIEQADKANPAVQANLGIALVKIKYYRGALDVLAQATRLDPNNVSAYAHLGYANYWIEDCRKALPALEKATELDPRNPDAWAWHEYLGHCHTHLKDYAAAESHCASSATLRPSDPRGQICLGKAQFNLKKYELATESFLKAYNMTTDTLYKSESRSGVLASLTRQNKLDSAPSLLGLPLSELSMGLGIEKLAESEAVRLERGEGWQY
jgi:tetratricopeptide (TPR) repeat protein